MKQFVEQSESEVEQSESGSESEFEQSESESGICLSCIFFEVIKSDDASDSAIEAAREMIKLTDCDCQVCVNYLENLLQK